MSDYCHFVTDASIQRLGSGSYLNAPWPSTGRLSKSKCNQCGIGRRGSKYNNTTPLSRYAETFAREASSSGSTITRSPGVGPGAKWQRYARQFYTGAVLGRPAVSPSQNHPVWAGFVCGSFHGNPQGAQVSAKFLDHVITCKRKEESDTFLGIASVLCLHGGRYSRFSLNNIFSFKYNES